MEVQEDTMEVQEESVTVENYKARPKNQNLGLFFSLFCEIFFRFTLSFLHLVFTEIYNVFYHQL